MHPLSGFFGLCLIEPDHELVEGRWVLKTLTNAFPLLALEASALKFALRSLVTNDLARRRALVFGAVARIEHAALGKISGKPMIDAQHPAHALVTGGLDLDCCKVCSPDHHSFFGLVTHDSTHGAFAMPPADDASGTVGGAVADDSIIMATNAADQLAVNRTDLRAVLEFALDDATRLGVLGCNATHIRPECLQSSRKRAPTDDSEIDRHQAPQPRCTAWMAGVVAGLLEMNALSVPKFAPMRAPTGASG